MITLYVSGSYFGLPDPSPFVCKVLVLLRMAGIAYKTAPARFGKAPKRKVPYIEDDGRLLGDSTFIRWHLETKHGADFDKGLSALEKASAWAYERLAEDHLYFALVDARWTDDREFDAGPRAFFKAAPAPVRPIVVAMIRRQVKRQLYAQGLGRHSRAEIVRLATRDLDAIATFLGDKPWLMGPEPCGADASVWSMVAGVLCPELESEIRRAGERHANLVAYRDRGMALWFPELATRS